MFSCEFCEISKNTFFIEHLWWLLLSILIFSHVSMKIQTSNQKDFKGMQKSCTEGSILVNGLASFFYHRQQTV